jgi:hypothetical protein
VTSEATTTTRHHTGVAVTSLEVVHLGLTDVQQQSIFAEVLDEAEDL